MSLIELFITFVEKNGTLLKIYGQHDQKSAEFLEKVIHQYTETFDRQKVCEPKSGRDIYPGLVCCARYKDNKYYRAEVKSVIQLAPGYVSVFFIDYGNTERVALSDIRLLDKVQEPSFTSLHRLATEYYLAGARPITSEWDEQTISFIEEAIRYRSIKCAIVGEVIGKKLLKIFWGESDISSYLISMGAAVPVTADVQEILIETSLGIVPTRYAVPPPPVAPGIRGGPLGYPIHAAAQYNPLVNQQIPPQGIPVSIRPPGLPIQPSIVPTPQPFSVPVLAQAKAQQFASEMLKENTEHIVYVSHVEEGPLSFAVQLKAVAEHALTELMAALNEHDPVPISRPLLPGSICLGRFSEDQSLCRAVVMHVMTDKCRLYYPDYGNSEVLPCTQIYDMPPQFIGAKVMALRFTLAGFRNIKVTQEMKDIFKELVTDRELLMKVAPMEENRTKQYCELYVNGRSVRDLMKERLAKNAVPVDYVKLHVPSRGSIERVVVSYVESPTRIVVQLESNQETLRTVMSCVATYCKDRHSIRYDQLKVNLPVCAFYPFDKTWYRAQIKEYNETEATVLFVDYGNEDVVSLTSLQRINSDLVTKVRTQALECCLAGFEMSQPNQELADKLFHIINEKTLTMQVLEVMKNQMLIVNLLDDNNMSVTTYLKPAPIQAPPPVTQPAYHSPPPPVAANTGGDDDWKEEEEPEVHHPSKSHGDSHYGSGRNDGGGKRFSNDDSGKNWRSNSREDPVSPRDNNKFDRFSRDDRKGSGSGGGGGGRWNSDRDDNKNWRSRDENDNRGGGGGGFNRRNNDDDFRSKKFGGDSRDDGFKKWDRSGDDNRRDGFKKWDRNEEKSDGFKKWDRNDDKSDGFKKWDRNDNKSDGFKKWDRNDDKSDGFKKWDRNDDKSDGFKKWDRNDDKSDGFKKRDSGSGGGFNKWNKENDRGGKPFGDGPRKFDSNRKFGSDSNDNWDSGSTSRSNGGGDFNERFSRFDSKKDSYSRQSSSKFGSAAPPKKVVVPYPSIDLGDNKTVDIVYSLSPVEFFVQLSDHKDELTTLMSDIATAYTTGGSQVEKAEKGLYCVAMYSEDETWYRALIESSTDSAATVNFIDYGNIEEVPLEKLKVITAELATLPSQAIKCGLIGVRPNADTGAWSDEEQTEFAVATESKTLKAEFKRKTFANDTYQIVLRDVTEDESSPVVINLAFNATEDDVNITTPGAGADDVTLLPFPLAVGETIDVQVTWFLSPHLFYIQPLHTNPMFREMMEHIQEHARSFTHLSSDDLKVGKFVIARFKDDKVLYRAEIKETSMFTDSLVYFVDYGNSEKMNKQSIYHVKSEYRVMPCQAIACSLAGVSPIEEWPKVGTSKMESYFEGDLYKCSVVSQSENGNFIISLRNQEDVSVSNLLIDNGFAVSDGVSYDLPTESAYTTVDLHLLLDQILLARVTFVENRSKFFVQLIPAEVAKLQQELDNYTGTPENMKNIETDNITDSMLCISTIDGTSWQRASVVNKNGTDGPLVLFVDSGVSKEVTNDKIYGLPDMLANIPYQAIECTLGVGDEGDDTSVVEGLKSEILDKDVLLSVDNLDTQRLVVTVYSSEGTIIDACGEKPDGLNNVNKIVPFPVYKKFERTFVSHAESGGIYLQRIADEESIKLLLGELFDFYDSMEAIEVDWKPDDLCCAKSSADDQWYRAIVKTVEPEMTVKYLDYGNSETLSTDRLRKLDGCFFKPASFALEVKMAVEWLVTEENLLELIPDKEFNTKIIRWQDGWYAELIDDSNENLTEKLVQLGFVKELENSPFIKKPSSISKLMTGTKVGVCRSHICSPSQFWVILNNDFEDLERLQDRLQNSAESMRNISGTPSSKAMIAAKLSDGIWYRVIYIPASNSIFSVDYGNTEPITEELKELPEDFLQPDGYAIPCSLSIEPIEGSWNEEAIKLFDSLITDDVHVASILKISEVITVDLNVSDENVSKSLIDQGFAVKSFLESSVYVSHVNSPSDFYVQEENPLLEQIRERLVKADEFETVADIASLKDKNVFAAQFQVDGLWYRAKLLSSNEGRHHVIFVDYGNSDDATEFKELPCELLEIPFMAKHCSLKLPESLDNWSDHAFDKFIQLVADGATLFDIKFLDDEDPASVELTLNGESVAEQLVSQAQPETVSTDCTHKVMVCYITTPVDFWIQFETAPINDMIDHFVKVDNWSVLEDADEGSLVAAMFEDDAQWYRAKVLSKTDGGKTKVSFVDYGNIYEASELRALPKELLEIPELAKHCSLKFSETIAEWSENTLEAFREITGFSSEVLDMKYIADGDPAIVELSIGEEDLASKLLGIEKCSNSTEKPIHDVESKEEGLECVVISHINSPADFYVHVNRDKVNEMSTMMAEGDNFEPLNKVAVGSLVAARFLDDAVWYRATITKTDENEHIVFFVDYGNCATVKELKLLPQEIADIPHLSQLCSLQSVSEEDWSDAATDKFFELNAYDSTEFQMKVINESIPVVVELLYNGTSVSEIISQCDEQTGGENDSNEKESLDELVRQETNTISSDISETKFDEKEVDSINNSETDDLVRQEIDVISPDSVDNKFDEKEVDSINYSETDDLVRQEVDAISQDSIGNKFDEKEVDSINYSETDDLVRQEIDVISPDSVGNRFDEKEVDSINNSETNDDLVRQEINAASSNIVDNEINEKEVLDSVKSRKYDEKLISSFIMNDNQCSDVGEDRDDVDNDDLQKECGAKEISANKAKDASVDKKPDIVECTNSKIESSDKAKEHDKNSMNNVETNLEEDVEKVDGYVKEISDNLGINVPNKTDINVAKIPLSEKIVPGAISHGTPLDEEQMSSSSDK